MHLIPGTMQKIKNLRMYGEIGHQYVITRWLTVFRSIQRFRIIIEFGKGIL